jgi:hypothetical protein
MGPGATGGGCVSTDGYEVLHQAAHRARLWAERLGDEQGVFAQIEQGDWDGRLTEGQAAELSAELESIAWRLQTSRAGAGSSEFHPGSVQEQLRVSLDTRLPMNRKERFFTGTVFPALVAADNFAHLGRLLEMCDLADVEPGVSGERMDVEFFTEYGFAESVVTLVDEARFDGAPTAGDTPDIVLCGSDWLLAIEAKVFDSPTPAAMRSQLQRQRLLVDYWSTHFGLAVGRVRHVALLPQPLSEEVGDLGVPVVTWEQLLAAYRPVAPVYWTAMLGEALSRYPELRTRSLPFGKKADGQMTGLEIVEQHASGELTYTFMGRQGGIDGTKLAGDLANGTWRSQPYEVRLEPIKAPNWFPITEFIRLTAEG